MSSDYRTLAEIEAEVNPSGRMVDQKEKEELVGQQLLVERVNFWSGEYGPSVFVTFVVLDTGERLATNFGSPMASKLESLQDHLPFTATLVTQETKRGFMYTLE